MINPRVVANLLSLSRIPLSLSCIVFFVPVPKMLNVCAGLCLVIFFTDIVDGPIARRAGPSGVAGRHWDSLGDKAFYSAMIVSLLSQDLIQPIIAWGLLFREISMYITRIWHYKHLDQILKSRTYTNIHGYCMYVVIVFGFINLYYISAKADPPIYLLGNLAAGTALFFGIASVFQFLKEVRQAMPTYS